MRVWGRIDSQGANQQRGGDGYWRQEHWWGPGVVGGLREGREGGREGSWPSIEKWGRE